MTFVKFSPAGSTEKAKAPERIHGWLHTQLSLARFYGGLTFQGYDYIITPSEPGCPLVRTDVLAREAKERTAAVQAARQAFEKKQGELL